MPSSTLMLLERILPNRILVAVTILNRVVSFIMLTESTIVDKESITRRIKFMARSTLMLLERILHGKSLFTVSKLKRMISFIVLLKSMIINKAPIARGAESMLRRPLMPLQGNTSPNVHSREKQSGIVASSLCSGKLRISTVAFCCYDSRHR